jgi:hypothetical protein
MTTPFNPYGGDANVHTVPLYEVPMVEQIGEKLVNNRVWYRYFQNVTDSNEYDACAVANLPKQATQGSSGYATDATASTFYSVVAGGGALFVPVFYDGTNWRIG